MQNILITVAGVSLKIFLLVKQACKYNLVSKVKNLPRVGSLFPMARKRFLNKRCRKYEIKVTFAPKLPSIYINQ